MSPVFVIGCARSGTTWLGRVLARTPGMRVTIEQQPQFHFVDQMALNPRRIPELFSALVWVYQRAIERAGRKTYADKSHQNIWLVEELAEAFPGARFLGVERSAYGVVASMIRHRGVQEHFRRWRDYPLPNRHIGLAREMAPRYDALPLAAKCALRWLSHHRRLEALRSSHGDALLVLDYERMIERSAAESRRLSEFLGIRLRIDDPVPGPPPDEVLSTADRRLIDRIVQGEEP